jgi:two-component system response regulator FixJ
VRRSSWCGHKCQSTIAVVPSATVFRGKTDVPSGSSIVAIVDDDGDVRDVLEALLESVGHTVKTYKAGRQLLDDPELSDVACLIADQKMPEMTGLALLRELNATGRAVPTFLITGLPDARVSAEARDLGAIDVFTKPIDWEKLLKLVAYAVQ